VRQAPGLAAYLCLCGRWACFFAQRDAGGRCNPSLAYGRRASPSKRPGWYWILKGGVSVSLSPSLIAAIERGVPLEFESIFRARQTHWGFWKRLVYQEKRVARLQFQPLTRLFYVFKQGAPVEAFDDLTKALRACLVVKDWRVAPPEKAFEGLELGLRLRLDENALPKPLLIGALTTADYQLTTGWLSVHYGEGSLLP